MPIEVRASGAVMAQGGRRGHFSRGRPTLASMLAATRKCRGYMITDEELAQLPDDPELAFVEFERIMRARLYEAVQEVPDDEFRDRDLYRLEYINKVLAAAKEYGIEVLSGWRMPSASDDQIYGHFLNFTRDVDHPAMQVRIRNAPRIRRNSVGLDGNTKTKIHHLITQIRNAIEAAELPVEKRESLYSKLNDFVSEVDKARTGLEAGMAVYIAICDGIGQGFKKLEPARRWIDSIATLLGRAKEVEDKLRPGLPPPTERKRLEQPQLKLPSPEQKSRRPVNDLDEEIPF
jgi:hypothetical protein